VLTKASSKSDKTVGRNEEAFYKIQVSRLLYRTTSQMI